MYLFLGILEYKLPLILEYKIPLIFGLMFVGKKKLQNYQGIIKKYRIAFREIHSKIQYKLFRYCSRNIEYLFEKYIVKKQYKLFRCCSVSRKMAAKTRFNVVDFEKKILQIDWIQKVSGFFRHTQPRIGDNHLFSISFLISVEPFIYRRLLAPLDCPAKRKRRSVDFV